jgi:hypothetical protein
VIPGLAIALGGLIGGVYLMENGNPWLGLAVVIAGFAGGGVVVLAAEGLALARNVWDWVALVRSRPDEVRVVAVHPPRGFLIRRDAKVTLDVTHRDGRRETMDQGLRIPWLQAALWRIAGRVPTPIGRLIDKRELNAKVWGRDRRPEQLDDSG